MGSLLTPAILKEVLSSNAAKKITETTLEQILQKVNFEERIAQHNTLIDTWSKKINFEEMVKSKRVDDSYIELDLFEFPISKRQTKKDKNKRIPINNILDKLYEHSLITGQPGSGKTTCIKYFCRQNLGKKSIILIRIRNLNTVKENSLNNILYKEIQNLFGLSLSILESINNTYKKTIFSEKEIQEQMIHKIHTILNKVETYVVVEGIDEAFTTTLREKITQDLEQLSLNLKKSKLIVTTRSADVYINRNNFETYEMAYLTENQIKVFVQRWMKNSEKVKDFLSQIKKSPYEDTTIKPLTLAHLCAIYEKSEEIPEKPKTTYKKIVDLLIEKWDEERHVKRYSKYSKFTLDRKNDYLCRLAYELVTEFKSDVFSFSNLIYVYHKIYSEFDLKHEECELVNREIESHTGLFIETGYQLYEFSHKSLQEFLIAKYIVGLSRFLNEPQVIKSFPNELAVAVSLSTNSSDYFARLVLEKLYRYKINNRYISVFINRINLEKIDFGKSDIILISILALYTKYFTNSNDFKNGQIPLILLDDDFQMFELTVKNILKKNEHTKKGIYKYYDLHDTMKDVEDDILFLKKKENLRKAIPNMLVTRCSFIA